jgi:uncharacterized protein HemX
MSQPTEPAAPQPTADQPVAKQGKSGIVFAVLAVVFFLAAAAMTGLYLVDKQATGKTLDEQKDKIASLQNDLTAKEGEVAEAKAEAEKYKTDAEKFEACSKAVQEFFASLDEEPGDPSSVIEMAEACEASLI